MGYPWTPEQVVGALPSSLGFRVYQASTENQYVTQALNNWLLIEFGALN
jgi:hypothetical protein